MSRSHKNQAKPTLAASEKKKTAPKAKPQKNTFANLITKLKNWFKKQSHSNPNQQTIKTGVVKFFSRSKGFGFIQEENGNEVFVHISALTSQIRESDKVTFNLAPGKRGVNAVNVKIV